MDGILLIVGEYLASHAEESGYIDKKFGNKITYIRAMHLVECAWRGHIDRVLITDRFPEEVASVEQAEATFRYTRGTVRVLPRLVQTGTRTDFCQPERLGD